MSEPETFKLDGINLILSWRGNEISSSLLIGHNRDLNFIRSVLFINILFIKTLG